MFLLRNQYKAAQVLMVLIGIALWIASPVESIAQAAIWITGLIAICIVSYLTRKAEKKHFINEEVRVVEIEPKWGGTETTMVTVETLSGARFYQQYESQIAAPRLNARLYVHYDPNDFQTFSIDTQEENGDGFWWLQTIAFLGTAVAVIIVGLYRS